ncbi:MAG: hypothetical protein ACFHWX_06395 [Bacteroidota bacterium]
MTYRPLFGMDAANGILAGIDNRCGDYDDRLGTRHIDQQTNRYGRSVFFH